MELTLLRMFIHIYILHVYTFIVHDNTGAFELKCQYNDESTYVHVQLL